MIDVEKEPIERIVFRDVWQESRIEVDWFKWNGKERLIDHRASLIVPYFDLWKDDFFQKHRESIIFALKGFGLTKEDVRRIGLCRS